MNVHSPFPSPSPTPPNSGNHSSRGPFRDALKQKILPYLQKAQEGTKKLYHKLKNEEITLETTKNPLLNGTEPNSTETNDTEPVRALQPSSKKNTLLDKTKNLFVKTLRLQKKPNTDPVEQDPLLEAICNLSEKELKNYLKKNKPKKEKVQQYIKDLENSPKFAKKITTLQAYVTRDSTTSGKA